LVQGEALEKRRFVHTKKKNPFNSEEDFFKAFNLMKKMVEELYNVRVQRRREDTSQVKNEDDHPSKNTTPSSPPS
jgi:hypothetical protein